MRHAIVSGETPVEYHSEFAVDENGFQWPLRSLNTAEKKAHGIYEIAFDFSVPVGHARVGMELALVGDDVIEQVTYEPMTQAQLFEAINRERERRIAAGSAFAVSGVTGPIPLTGRPFDQTVYLALLTRAQGYKAAGVTDPVLTIRDGADTIHEMTPDQMISLVSQSMTWFEQVMAVSWAMKDETGDFTGGIPADFTADTHWPS